MIIYKLEAFLSEESLGLLQDITKTSPFRFQFYPVEVMASVTPLEEQPVSGASFASTLGLVSAFDESTSSSPSIILLKSQDLEGLHAQVGGDYAWSYPYQPYMRVSTGSVPRRRHIVAFLNSISNTLAQNPLGLVFDTFRWTTADVKAEPFHSYFSNLVRVV